MKFAFLSLVLFALSSPLFAQEELVTLRFLSFPKNASPQPVELLTAEGESIEVQTPTNALSRPYKVKSLAAWSVGKLEPAKSADEKPVFKSYGSAPSLASDDQLILLIRNGKENADGMRVVPMDNKTGNFRSGQFFFMNASKVDIATMLGGTKFALQPGKHTIIEPTETKNARARISFSPNSFSARRMKHGPSSPAHGRPTKRPAAWCFSTTTPTTSACACTPSAITCREPSAPLPVGPACSRCSDVAVDVWHLTVHFMRMASSPIGSRGTLRRYLLRQGSDISNWIKMT